MAFTIPFKEMVELTEIFFDSDWFATISTPFKMLETKNNKSIQVTLNYSE